MSDLLALALLTLSFVLLACLTRGLDKLSAGASHD